MRGPSEWTGRGRGAACVKGECKQGLVDLHLSWTMLEMLFGSVAGREEERCHSNVSAIGSHLARFCSYGGVL